MFRSAQRACAAWLCAAGVMLSVTAARGAQTLPHPAVDDASARAGSVQPQPVQPRARVHRRLVYTCIEPGLVTYSDRPCGGTVVTRRELEVRTPAVVSGAGPGAEPDVSSAADKRRAAAAKADAAAARAATERAATCERLEAAVDEIDAKMRAGYPAREAGRLWDRWREARARLREAHC